MNNTLSKYLMNYAVESGEIEDPSHIGASEFTVVTDETMTELEESVSDMADAVEKLENNDSAAEKMIEATESLECYVAQLRARRERGVALSADAGNFLIQGMAASLEARDIPAGIFSSELEGMAHSFESASVTDYSVEAEEKAEGILKRLYNMLLAAGRAAWQFIKDFVKTFGTSGKVIVASGDKLTRVAAAIKGEANGELKGKSFKLITASSGNVDPVLSLSRLEDGYKDLQGLIENINVPVAAIRAALKEPTVAAINEAGKKASTVLPENKEISLFGGLAFHFKKGEVEGLDRLAKATFTLAKAEVQVKDKVEPASVAVIKSIGTSLKSIGGTMIDAVKDINAAGNEIDGLVKGAAGALKAEGIAKEDADAAKQVMKAASSTIALISKMIPSYVKVMGEVSKNAYAFGIQSASKYKEGAAKKEANEEKEEKDGDK